MIRAGKLYTFNCIWFISHWWISRKDQEEDDRKRGRGRDRGSYGPTSSFSEKKNYKPTVNLEYIDDNGRAMSSKEAFRFLRWGLVTKYGTSPFS